MLRWIGQKFNNKSKSNSLTQSQLDQTEGNSSSILSSNLDLTDGDYEFLFNQLLEGIAHGWHQVRIAKFFQQLEERGEVQKWVAWLKRFDQKLPTSPNPIQRQLGARMIRLGELTQSHPKLKEIGALSDEIGRKLFFSDIKQIIWEYDGLDVVSPPIAESNTLSTPDSKELNQETDSESIVVDNLISNNSEARSESTVIQNPLTDSPATLALDREEFLFVPEDDPESTIIPNPVPDNLEVLSTEEFPVIPAEDAPESTIMPNPVPDNLEVLSTEEFPVIPAEDAPESTIMPNPVSDNLAALSLDMEEEFPVMSEDETESTIMPNPVPDNLAALSLDMEEFPVMSEDATESPWEQPELPLNQDKPEFPDLSSVSSVVKNDQELSSAIAEKAQTNLEAEPITNNVEQGKLLEGWFDLGLKQANMKDWAKAIASWDKVLEFNPELAEVWHNRGSALGRLGKYAESVKSFDRALKIEPNHYQAWNDRAHALYLMEKWQEAIESWNKAISIMPNNHQFWYNRGRTLEKLNLIQEAITSYEKALEIQPDFEAAKSRYLNLLKET